MWRDAIGGLIFVIAASVVPAQTVDAGWPTYGGDAGGQRYSTARQINRNNVTQLKPVWVYHTHALDSMRPGSRAASFEATPILFHGTLYLSTPFDEIIALDPVTGVERWTYAPQLGQLYEADLITSRGVATWDGGGKGLCSARIFVGTIDAQLISVDAATGKPCDDFGDHGRINLKAGLAGMASVFHITSAPTVLGDIVVVGSSIPDNSAVNMAKGTVRAYDTRTGKQVWTWEPLPLAKSESQSTGAGNVWSTISADPTLGLLYLPTGSASPDYYGESRPGDGRDADSIVALDAATGRKVWAFQVVHHNLWDYDVPSEPLLFTWHGNIPAVAVTTKMGMVFVLDRRTGTPLFPVEERPVPKSDVEGERTSPTQPFSSLPPLSPLTIPVDRLNFDRDEANTNFCRKQISRLRYDGLYTPPSLRGSLVFPGAIGGVNWGSAAYDPASGILYANTNRLPYFVMLIPKTVTRRMNFDREMARKRSLLVFAVIIFLAISFALMRWRRGNSTWAPILLMLLGGIALVYGASQRHAADIYKEMSESSSPKSVEEAKQASLHAAFGEDHSPQEGAPYSLYRHPIVDTQGLPCMPVPWGTVAALNLQTGKMEWEQTHGTQVNGRSTGSVSLSGVIVTAGGLVLSAGTKEPVMRAYDAATGKELWNGKLTVPAQASPMTYEVGGHQFVVIADGGHGLFGTPTGDSVIAFGLN